MNIKEDSKRTKAFIRNYSHYLPIRYAKGHPSIPWVRRNKGLQTEEPRNQVTTVWVGCPGLPLIIRDAVVDGGYTSESQCFVKNVSDGDIESGSTTIR